MAEKIKTPKLSQIFCKYTINVSSSKISEQYPLHLHLNSDTLKLVDECQFDNSFTFIYSPRVGTPAAAMEDNVPMEDKERRLQTLMKHTNHWAKEKNKAYEGQIVEVLVDGPSKKNPNVFSGYTPQNKLVNFTGENIQSGTIVDVEIIEAKSFSLDGIALKVK